VVDIMFWNDIVLVRRAGWLLFVESSVADRLTVVRRR
jgi:hypothetical protein